MKNQMTRRPQTWIDAILNEDIASKFSYGSNIDIYQVENTYYVEADLPGFSREDITIEFKGDVLTLDAQRDESDDASNAKNYFYRSRSARNFNRQIRFQDVNAAAIDAAYTNGVLKVALPILSPEPESSTRIIVK